MPKRHAQTQKGNKFNRFHLEKKKVYFFTHLQDLISPDMLWKKQTSCFSLRYFSIFCHAQSSETSSDKWWSISLKTMNIFYFAKTAYFFYFFILIIKDIAGLFRLTAWNYFNENKSNTIIWMMSWSKCSNLKDLQF